MNISSLSESLDRWLSSRGSAQVLSSPLFETSLVVNGLFFLSLVAFDDNNSHGASMSETKFSTSSRKFVTDFSNGIFFMTGRAREAWLPCAFTRENVVGIVLIVLS